MSTGAAVPNGVSREEAQLLTEAIIMVRKQHAQREKVTKAEEEKKSDETERSGTLCWIAGKLPKDPRHLCMTKRVSALSNPVLFNSCKWMG